MGHHKEKSAPKYNVAKYSVASSANRNTKNSNDYSSKFTSYLQHKPSEPFGGNPESDTLLAVVDDREPKPLINP